MIIYLPMLRCSTGTFLLFNLALTFIRKCKHLECSVVHNIDFLIAHQVAAYLWILCFNYLEKTDVPSKLCRLDEFEQTTTHHSAWELFNDEEIKHPSEPIWSGESRPVVVGRRGGGLQRKRLSSEANHFLSIYFPVTAVERLLFPSCGLGQLSPSPVRGCSG